MKYVLCIGVISKGKVRINTNDANKINRMTKQD